MATSRTAVIDARPTRMAWAVVAIIAGAAVWRAVVLTTMPCISRDSVTFCWYARDLGQRGLALLREPSTQQHPLFPALVLAAERIALAGGAPDTPMTWQRSGQAVCWLAGMCVVVLAGIVTRRLVVQLGRPVNAGAAGCLAMLVAAVLPLDIWLSAEVMSDQLHLALYLAGIWTLLKLDNLKAALWCGLAGGLAFLTRPEGLTVALAGLVALAADVRQPGRARAGRGVVLAVAFLACGLPFWLATGKLTTKQKAAQWLQPSESVNGAGAIPAESCNGALDAANCFAPGHAGAADLRVAGRQWFDAPRFGWDADRGMPVASIPNPNESRSGRALLARLELLYPSWYGVVPYVLYQLLRAGRIVVPLLALPALTLLGRRLWRPPLIGLTACLIGHFALAALLLTRSHYLDQRHMLVDAALLIPFAGLTLARLAELARGQRRWLYAIAALCLLPLAWYSLRQPNRSDRYLVDAACWLTQRDPAIASRLVMTASSERRIVFYAGARWLYWYDVPGDVDGPREQILRARPDYFILEVGRGFERDGNRQVAEELRADPELSGHLRAPEIQPAPEGGKLWFFLFDWAGP